MQHDSLNRRRVLLGMSAVGLGAAGLTLGARSAAQAASELTIFAAGTLAKPFRSLDGVFSKGHGGMGVQPQFGGSVKMAKQVTELHEVADIVAVADYSVIPKYLMPKYTSWYAGFASNAVTFIYTERSKFAGEINAHNWYEVLARPGVQIGRSNPDTDPSGYQTLWLLDLASMYYHQPGLGQKILANAPVSNMRDTETELIPALQSGQIDYLAIYRSSALQQGYKFLELPPQINLSDARFSSFYAKASARTKNGTLKGTPIVYAATVPNNAAHAQAGLEYLALLLGGVGKAVLEKAGFGAVSPGYAFGGAHLPAALRSLTKPWPLA
ncbi:MAG TPA: extracellular solute-binding protein [Candidatus Dormibacteraeota bacterium]|nr:extracellular solute-binding protein [Candidatus Dormibacteraeota bacterium]